MKTAHTKLSSSRSSMGLYSQLSIYTIITKQQSVITIIHHIHFQANGYFIKADNNVNRSSLCLSKQQPYSFIIFIAKLHQKHMTIFLRVLIIKKDNVLRSEENNPKTCLHVHKQQLQTTLSDIVINTALVRCKIPGHFTHMTKSFITDHHLISTSTI